MGQIQRIGVRDGFALVELLTVVVVIGVLVAVAIPVYNHILQTVETRACQANLRTIDGAVQQWRMADETNTGNPVLASDIMGTYIVDPIVCPTSKTFEYDIDNGVAVCNNGHSYR